MRAIMKAAGFPVEAENFFLENWDKLCQNDSLNTFQSLLHTYHSEKNTTLASVSQALNSLSEQTNIHIYSLCMLFCLQYAKIMESEYKIKKIPTSIFKSTIEDFKHKLIECHKRFGIWGTFVFGWYENIFRLKCFGIGRLEFERIHLPFVYADEHIVLEEGSQVINVHIPSGSPLTQEACMDSFRQAYAFFGFSDIMPIYCHSWLLFPPYRYLFAPNSNLEKFVDMFQIVREHQTEQFDDFWRVFDTEDFHTAVPKTTLQKQMLSYMHKTPKFGLGEGICLFNGRKIIK